MNSDCPFGWKFLIVEISPLIDNKAAPAGFNRQSEIEFWAVD